MLRTLMTTVRTVGCKQQKAVRDFKLKGVFGRQWLAYSLKWEAGKWAETTALEMAGNQKHLVGRTLPLGSWP